MHAGDVALAALRRLESGKTADGQELGAYADLLHFAKEIVEADAVTADDDKIRQLQLAAKQLHSHERPSLDDFLMTADRGEAVGAAEGGHASRALTHRVGNVVSGMSRTGDVRRFYK